MYHISFKEKKIVALLTLLMWLLSTFSPFVFAQEATSTSFMTRNTEANNFGGSATSTNFSASASGGQAAQGEATSSNFVLDSGNMYFDTFAPYSQKWRWYDDETHETPISALASEDVAPANITNLNIIKLRISVAETAGIGETNTKFRLQYSTSSDFSESVRNVAEQVGCSGTSVWCYADGAGADNVVITTNVLSDSDLCSAGVGQGCGTHNESGISTSSFTHLKNAVAEYEFTVEQSGATDNTVYFFRLFDTTSSTTVPLNAGESYPSLSTEGATLSFTINGLPAATTTEGVTTGIDTTSTGVAFGALPDDVSTIAAQRLKVTTNAAQGYRIFAFQQQALLGYGGGQIDPVTGTNASPAGWSSGCDPSAPSCYGYHSGEDVLAGGSTRFAADDTYAQFTSTPNEIAYSAVPVTEKSTDIVYRILVRTLQASDSYSGGVVYIATPVF